MTLSLSDYLAGFALVVSIYTLYQTSRYRGGDILLAAIKERAELAETLVGLDGVTASLVADWKAVLAARGLLNSGARLQREQNAAKLQERIEALKEQFSAIEPLAGWRARRRAESTLASLHALRAKANALIAEVDEERDNLRRNQEDFRASVRSSRNVPPLPGTPLP